MGLLWPFCGNAQHLTMTFFYLKIGTVINPGSFLAIIENAFIVTYEVQNRIFLRLDSWAESVARFQLSKQFPLQKEWNPQIARINNGAFAIQGFMSDMNSGTRVSSPKINPGKEMPVTRTAPTKPMPWHLYKNTLVNLPAFLRDNTLPPPTIDEKLFNLMIGNLDHINSNPSINSNKQTGQVCGPYWNIKKISDSHWVIEE